MLTRKEKWKIYEEKISIFSKKILQLTIGNVYHIRNHYANKYLKGDGFEIGALTSPVFFHNQNVSVKYIDYLTRLESSEKCNVPFDQCVDVDIVADGNNLCELPSGSAAFIVANHVLEHSPDPIGTILEWLRVVEDDGIVYFSVPNYRCNEFDFLRNPVTLEHLVADYKNNGAVDIETIHVEEHVELIDGIAREREREFSQRKEEIIKSNLHTHFHVFDERLILEMLSYVNKVTPVTVVDYFAYDYGFENIFLIRKDFKQAAHLVKKHNRLFRMYVLMKSFCRQIFQRGT